MEPTSQATGHEIWEALKSPDTWSALQGVATLTGHTVAAAKIPVYAVLFGLLANLFGPHPNAPATPKENDSSQG